MSFFLPDPPKKYRPSPFWSWNADLKPEELRRQIRLMHDAGLGGFFMHARSGLQVEYLSDEWMKCVEASLDEAGKLGMDAWLYDENGWPSGFGGGLVNGLGINYQAKYLRCEKLNAEDAGCKENTIAFYSADGETLLGRTLPEGISGEIMRCYYDVNPFYVDNLNADVVAEFLRVTHEHYYKNIPAETLKHLRGIFTDEPQLSRNGFVWSFVLEEAYKKAYNSDLIPLLPQLFFEMPRSHETKIRFWKLCSEIFSKAFMKQVRDWCTAHGWELTGHHVLEEWFCHQLSSNGSIMPQYRYYTLPGVDHLCRYNPSGVAATQLVSVAGQYGHKQLLTESFALTGWACNFTGMRWIYQQQMAFGINYLCQHLQGYSLRGRRKRDYPQSCFYHQPWWEDYKILNDYFSKIGMIIAEGEAQVDTLVIHPISSVWKKFIGEYNLMNITEQTEFEKLDAELKSRLVQHHYADEIIVDECGSVSGKEFIIGKCSYHTVIIPQITNTSRKIFELLKKLMRNGGTVIKVKEVKSEGAFTIDGVLMDMDEREFFNSIPAFDSEAAAAEFAASRSGHRIKITENGIQASSITGTWRDVEISGQPGRFYYFANTNYRSGVNARLELPACGKKMAVISQMTGEFFQPANLHSEDGKFILDHQFGAADALALFVSDSEVMDDLPHEQRFRREAAAIRLLPEKSWQIAQCTDNILTLDYCRFRVDGGEWQYADPIDAQTRLLDLERSCDLEIEYDFSVDDDFDFDSPVDMAVEEPEKFIFTLNGQEFKAEKNGILFDKDFHRIRLPQNFRPGVNTIGMKLHFSQQPEVYEMIRRARKFESEYNKLVFDTEIESIYLCGSFSVRHSGSTTPLAKDASRLKNKFSLGAPLKGDIINCRDLLNAGLPFFAGKIILRNSFTLTPEEMKKISWLSFSLKGANSAGIKINGSDCGKVFWEPFAVPVAGKLQVGINTIEIELTTSLRNMLGPHHLLSGESYEVGTLSFNREPSLLRNNPPQITPDYCMVDLGIGDLKFTE